MCIGSGRSGEVAINPDMGEGRGSTLQGDHALSPLFEQIMVCGYRTSLGALVPWLVPRLLFLFLTSDHVCDVGGVPSPSKRP